VNFEGEDLIKLRTYSTVLWTVANTNNKDTQRRLPYHTDDLIIALAWTLIKTSDYINELADRIEVLEGKNP
jgi:hypothetical protein